MSGYWNSIRSDAIAFRCDTCRDLQSVEIFPGSGQWKHCPDCTAPVVAALQENICGLTPAERAVTLTDIEPTGGTTDTCLMAARAFMIRRAGMLTLWGGSGNAKTTILQAVVNECLAGGISAIYTTAWDFIGYIRAAQDVPAYTGAGESDWKRVRRFESIRVLCIDEADKVKQTDYAGQILTAIFDRRYREAMAGLSGTLIAMNDEPRLVFPPWIVSRLADGRNRIIENTDPDVRPELRD